MKEETTQQSNDLAWIIVSNEATRLKVRVAFHDTRGAKLLKNREKAKITDTTNGINKNKKQKSETITPDNKSLSVSLSPSPIL